MKRSELHAIAVRRRGDPDVKALLLEIRRLHEAMADAHELFLPVAKAHFDALQLAKWKRVTAALEASRAIVRPAEPAPRRPARRPEHERPYEYLSEERRGKRLARDKRS